MSFIEKERYVENLILNEYCKYTEEGKTGTLTFELTFYKGGLVSLIKAERVSLRPTEKEMINPLNNVRRKP